MAFYDGFFDAVEESEGEYDREYNSAQFTEYFASFIGSGVCIAKDVNSMLVRLEDGALILSPGYLFISGYWLKNSEDYPITFTGTGDMVVLARLNLGTRTIDILVQQQSTGGYPNALALANVTVNSSGTPTAVTDTRYDTEICGVIDAAGALRGKIDQALDYIDNEAQPELDRINAEIDAKGAQMNREVARAYDEIASISPPAIGTVKFSAADQDENWLLCDGSYIQLSAYPELVDVLWRTAPGARNWTLRSSGVIGRDISNGYVFGGYIWIFSLSESRLHGVSLSDGAARSIAVTSTSSGFSALIASEVTPLALTILDGGELFLAQVRGAGAVSLLKYTGFTGSENTIALTDVFPGFAFEVNIASEVIPYVQKVTIDGVVTYGIATASLPHTQSYDPYRGYVYNAEKTKYYKWAANDTEPTLTEGLNTIAFSVFAFNRKNAGEALGPTVTLGSGASSSAGALTKRMQSFLQSTYAFGYYLGTQSNFTSVNCTPVAGGADGNIVVMGYSVDTSSYSVRYVSPSSAFTSITLPPYLAPANMSRSFKDGVVYAASAGLWLFFVGTGVIFTSDVASANSYGYFSTTDVMGMITQYGFMDYDAATNQLFIIGQNEANEVKVATVDLSTWSGSATSYTGAYLPRLSVNGIPGYIKALEG